MHDLIPILSLEHTIIIASVHVALLLILAARGREGWNALSVGGGLMLAAMLAGPASWPGLPAMYAAVYFATGTAFLGVVHRPRR